MRKARRAVATHRRDWSSLTVAHAKHHAATETVLPDLLDEVRKAKAAGVRLVPEEVAT